MLALGSGHVIRVNIAFVVSTVGVVCLHCFRLCIFPFGVSVAIVLSGIYEAVNSAYALFAQCNSITGKMVAEKSKLNKIPAS